MPALNEEANLESAVQNVLDAFQTLKINGEIIIVNDGSADRTGEIAQSLAGAAASLKVIRHETPLGIGASFWDGILASEGEIVVMLPGDGENDAAEILKYLLLMEHVDIVIPFVFNVMVRSWMRRALSGLYRSIINSSFGMTLRYMNGTVMYRRSILEGMELSAKGFFYQTELLIKCIRNGYLYAEVPYALLRRATGRSKAMSFRSLKSVSKAYLTTLRDVYFSGLKALPFAPDSRTAARWKDAG